MVGAASSGHGVTVIKVGGSLLQGADDLHRVAAALAQRRREGQSLLVVASALKGVTDLLDRAAGLARAVKDEVDGNEEALAGTLAALRSRHLEISRQIASDGATLDRVVVVLAELETLVRRLSETGDGGEPDPGLYAHVLSYGERLSVILLACALRRAGLPAEAIDAEAAGLRAGGPPRNGECDLGASAAGLAQMRRDLRERVLVLTGFYGVGDDGGVILFGRGGSDDTACAAAAGLGADRVELWKDVPGFMSADPREVSGARLVQEVSFDEVAQLGAFGSRVVHYGCLEPLRGRPIQVFLSSIPREESDCGTRLVERLDAPGTRVVALAARRGSPSLVGLVGEGVASDPRVRSRMLSCLSAAQVRTDLVAHPSGASGLSCSVHPDDIAPALRGLHDSFFPSSEAPQP